MSEFPLAIIGCDAPDAVKAALSVIGFKLCILPHDERLQIPVRSHADMLMRIIDNSVFCSKDYYEKNTELFSVIEKYGYTVTKSDAKISAEYPNDVAFNVISVKSALIGKLDSCATEILEYAHIKDIQTVSVRQGYTACSTLVLGDSALISADSGIIRAAQSIGMSALKIQSSPTVRLAGYERGFIGGACGVYKNNVYFAGNYKEHPDAELISDFCQKHGYEPVSLCDIPLTDVGGIIFLPSLI